MTRLTIGVRFLVLVSLAAPVGCSREPMNRKETYPVTGVVTVDGQPAAGLKVELHDVKGIDAQNPSFSSTFTDEQGRYSLSTYEQGDGVPEGEYKVTFFWGEVQPFNMAYGGEDKLKNKYSDPAKTQFSVKVQRGTPADMGKIELSTK
jgi:5-hydroxyisourate hydrolase-like protein (transthyretin family)